MYISAYDTLATRSIILTKVISGIELAHVSGKLITENNQFDRMEKSSVVLPKDVGIYLEQSPETPQFAHPVIIPPSSLNDHKSIVVVDGRPMARSIAFIKEGKFVPNNYDMYEFQILRANITSMLIRNEISLFSNIITPVTKIMSLWIQRAITRQYVVNQEIASIVQTCGVVYCYAMFSGSSVITEEMKQLWSIRLQRDFPYLSKQTTELVISEIKSLSDVVQLVELIKQTTATPILHSLTPVSFLQAIGSGWDAFNSREMMSVAIENLPTLLAVITKSQTQSFSKTAIGQHVKTVLGGGMHEFLKTMLRITSHRNR